MIAPAKARLVVGSPGAILDEPPELKPTHVLLIGPGAQNRLPPEAASRAGAPGRISLQARQDELPSVIFRSGGLPEIVRHLVDGAIWEEKPPAALADGISSPPEDEDGRRETARVSSGDFEARYGPERFARQWVGAFLWSSGSAPSLPPGHECESP